MTKDKAPERDIDVVLQRVTQEIPEVEVEQLTVKWPGEDDNLWWFHLPEARVSIQIEGFRFPLLIETDEQSSGEALKATTVDEAVGLIVTYLQSVKAGQPTRLTGDLFWR